ncbi:putative ATP binding protein [Sporodiniella umbellata]|nr:putative ATP binding protein [Sporodiniella umbellata]
MIVDREIEITQKLSQRILEHKNQLTKLEKVLSYLDCLLSFSVVALKYNYTQPTMTETSVLEIHKGRHPLQEISMSQFIPNDTHLKGGEGFESSENETLCSIQVVTGANFSGKSVYLKQVALIVYMAHIGSFVPAKDATIGITDKLFIRAQTSETISKHQSAFVYDLQQLKKALLNSTCQSLIVIDEFGKGTENTDGAALFSSILGYFLSKGTQCPKVLSSTHFHDIFQKNILSCQKRITFSHTEIVCQEIDSLDGEPKKSDVVFLYRITPGIGSMASYGTWCAGIAGLPTEVIERSLVLSDKYSKEKDIDKVVKESDQERFSQLETIATGFLEQDIMQGNPYDTIKAISDLFK